jgi:arylsulfatase A-like enzyme
MTRPIRNILFIMCDQLRFDYLGCTGHASINTPNIDALARRGVLFRETYVQSPVCGSSRMSFYTGRYVSSHGATWNGVPLRVGELTMGDYLRPLGMGCHLVGKTHMRADKEGMERLGISPDSIIGVRVAECGFDPFERDDGLHAAGPRGRYAPRPAYEDYLNNKGYAGEYPWQDNANGVETDEGVGNGFAMRHATAPARIREEDSETPYMTRRAMDFIAQAGESRWCLHLSYIKPHWPYIAPAPYHAMYGGNAVQPVIRSEAERANPHPIYKVFMESLIGKNFGRDEVREAVIPAYMGLITQIDDQLGLLFAFLEERGLASETMIVFTSDHGDYLGDHWLGEKDLFHAPSVKVPLIVFDPLGSADATRGTVSDALVEAIDLLPTFIEAAGGDPAGQAHRLEGRSLMPLIQGKRIAWRDAVFSEYDYSHGEPGIALNVPPHRALLFMVFDGRWKYTHAPGFRPMLFDLENDPHELFDLGADPLFAAERARLHARLAEWALRLSQRVTKSDAEIIRGRMGSNHVGILIGVFDESDVPAEYWRRPD